MLDAKKGWEEGGYPGQHLWGINLLNKQNFQIDILQFEKYRILNKIGKLFGINYFDQQIVTTQHP